MEKGYCFPKFPIISILFPTLFCSPQTLFSSGGGRQFYTPLQNSVASYTFYFLSPPTEGLYFLEPDKLSLFLNKSGMTIRISDPDPDLGLYGLQGVSDTQSMKTKKKACKII